MDYNTPAFPVHHQLPKPTQTHVHCVSDAIQTSHPFSFCLQSFPASGSFPMSRFFASGGQSIKSFSFSISPSNEYSGLVSFWKDWFDLLAVQGTLKSLPNPQFKSINSLGLSFLYSQSSNTYMTTGKTIALTRETFVGKLRFRERRTPL